MFSNVGGGEWMLLQGLAFLAGLIPIVIVVWLVVILLRVQRSIDRIATAMERLASLPPRAP